MGGSAESEENDSLHDDLDDFPLPEGVDDLEDLDNSEAEAEAPDDPDDPEDPDADEAHEASEGSAPKKDIEIPEHPTRTGVKCAEYFARGLPREGLEPISVMPGRSHAVARDIVKIVQDFKEQLRGVQLKVGTFPKFREMYRKWGASVLVEKGNREEPRDVFQFVCGMCWQYFIELEDMASKVGVVFLVYLLFHTQYHSRYAIPVTIDLLQQLTVLRDQCVAQEIFLELPAVLREMAQKDLFSVGLRATCRSLWFDRHGHLIERQVSKAKSAQSTLVTIQRPPDLTNLQKKVAEYEEMNEKAEVIPKADPSSSDQVNFIAAATQRYVNSVDPGELPEGGAVPVIEIDENENAKKKSRRIKFARRRVVEDPEDNDVDETPACQIIMAQRKEVVAGKPMDVWRRTYATPNPLVQRLGLEAAVNGGTTKRLLATVEQTIAQAETLADAAG